MQINKISYKGVEYDIGSNVYSAEERIIGIWIDGKPLYQKTIVFENGTGTTSETSYPLSDFGITNVEEIFVDGPSYFYHNATKRNCPFNWYDGSAYKVEVSTEALWVNVSYEPISKCKMVFTLKYTKTTDMEVTE